MDRCGKKKKKKKVFPSFGPRAKFFSVAENAVFLAQIKAFSLNKIKVFWHTLAGSSEKLYNI